MSSDWDLNGRTNVAAMVRLAAYCDLELGLDIDRIGRAGLDPQHSCTLVMSAATFLYEVKTDGGWVFVAVASMDGTGELEQLFRVGDTVKGWQTVQRFILALEKSGLRSL